MMVVIALDNISGWKTAAGEENMKNDLLEWWKHGEFKFVF